MCAGTREDGTQIAANDPVWYELHTVALAAQTDPRAWLEQRHFYGSIADNARFAEVFSTALRSLVAQGVSQTLAQYLQKL
jgi:mannitol 2-dehydrogenase